MFKCSWDWREGIRHVKFQLIFILSSISIIITKTFFMEMSVVTVPQSYKYMSTWIQITEESTTNYAKRRANTRVEHVVDELNVPQIHVVFANVCSFQFDLD
jgi:hypothetical protein